MLDYVVLRKISRFLSITAVSAVVVACSSFSAGSIFNHYSAQNRAVYQAVKAGQYKQANDLLLSHVIGAGDILDNMEKGRVSFLNQSYSESKAYLEESEVAVRTQQGEAIISLKGNISSASSLVVNDNLNSYYPADYELAFLHLYLALNYLHDNSLEEALVEVRKANQIQEMAKKIREAELASAEKEIKKSKFTPNLGAILSQYPDAGQLLQAVQNGYLFFLSALLYETAGELNDAYVDYKRALAVMPDNKEVIDGTIRVAKKLGRREDLSQLVKQYSDSSILSGTQGRIIVIDEQGIVSAKQSWKRSLPIYARDDWSYYTVSLPYYPKQALPQLTALQINGKPMSPSKLIDVNLMAQQDLTERMPAILFRQALRVIAKEKMRRESEKLNDVSSLLVSSWNILTDQPDTRSWQTLPAEVYSSSKVVESGEYELKFFEKSYSIKVNEGRTVLVLVTRQGTNATFWHKQLGML